MMKKASSKNIPNPRLEGKIRALFKTKTAKIDTIYDQNS